MKNNIQNLSHRFIKKPAFTLVEVLITITILGLIFTSVMSVFIYYSTLGAKVEADRLLQSNIKNIIEHITADIKENGINFGSLTHSIDGLYDGDIGILYVGNHKYYIAGLRNADSAYLPGVEPDWGRVLPNEYNTKCSAVSDNCTLIKEVPRPSGSPERIPLSNTWVSFKNMYFHVSDDYIPKVTINFNMGIASGKGLSDGVIKANNIQIQTTISEKLLDQNI